MKELVSLTEMRIACIIVFFIFGFLGTITCKDGDGYFIGQFGDRETDSGWVASEVILIILAAILCGLGLHEVAGFKTKYAVFFLGCGVVGGIVGSTMCVKNESWFTDSGSGGMRGWLARLF